VLGTLRATPARRSTRAAEHGLLCPTDPGSVKVATIGGSIAECAGGLRGLKYGVTKHVTGLEVVLANGDTVRLGGKGSDDEESARAPVLCRDDSSSQAASHTWMNPSLTITDSPPIHTPVTSPRRFSVRASSTLGRPISTPCAIRQLKSPSAAASRRVSRPASAQFAQV